MFKKKMCTINILKIKKPNKMPKKLEKEIEGVE